ncbi:MAG: hypothetical protein J6B94_00525 [Lachnospiraceae bacterium]|nr:hypothetical protein [Lachnospiraceae bacterium]
MMGIKMENGIEQLEKNVKDWEKIERREEVIRNTPLGGLKSVAFALAQEVPVLGSLVTETIDMRIDEHQSKVKKALIDTILDYEGIIEPDKIEGVSFLIEYAKTQEVLVRLANDKKVCYICNLFGNYFLAENHQGDVDLYEEYLNQLSSLSYREIDLLMCLEHFERLVSHEHLENKMQRSQKAYGKFKLEAKKRWKVSEKQLEGIMMSISKSGFCKELTGIYLGYEGGIFYTTAYFQHFLRYITKRFLTEE